MRVLCSFLGIALLLSLAIAPAASAQAGSAVAWEVITMDGGASAARATNIGVVKNPLASKSA